jgi:hypothetical protein
MKHWATLTLVFAFAGPIHSQAEEVLPPQFQFDRYAKMVEQSPFALATAVAAPAATPDFAKDLYIANAAHSAEGDMVTLASTADHNFKKYLTTKEPVEGYSIANIEWSDKVGATKVTISKDGNFATLTFNQALLSQAANAGAAGRALAPALPMPPLPNSAGNPSAPKLPAGLPAEVQQLIPSKEMARPHARGLIQRNPNSKAAQRASQAQPPSAAAKH